MWNLRNILAELKHCCQCYTDKFYDRFTDLEEKTSPCKALIK